MGRILAIISSMILVASLAMAELPPLTDPTFREFLDGHIKGMSDETKKLAAELGERLHQGSTIPGFVGVSDYVSAMRTLKWLSKQDDYSAMSKGHFGELVKRSCAEILGGGMEEAVQKTRTGKATNFYRIHDERKWLIITKACKAIDYPKFNEILEMRLGMEANMKSLEALAVFRSHLGMSKDEEESSYWSELVSPVKVDKALMELFKDKAIMKPIKEGNSFAVFSDLYNWLVHICDRFDPEVVTRLYAFELSLAPKDADPEVVDRLRSLKVCELLPLDEDRVAKLHKEATEHYKKHS